MSLRKRAGVLFSWLKQIILIVVLTFSVTIFVVQTYDISDVSMEPTFDRQGNRVVVFLTPSLLGALPDYEDIVIIDSRVERTRTFADRVTESPLPALLSGEAREYMWVKRVIGLPGDTIESANSRIMRNGQELTEPYIALGLSLPFDSVVVPLGHIFVLGDNRSHSSDSRVIGPVPVTNIQGRVVMRIFPLSKITTY